MVEHLSYCEKHARGGLFFCVFLQHKCLVCPEYNALYMYLSGFWNSTMVNTHDPYILTINNLAL